MPCQVGPSNNAMICLQLVPQEDFLHTECNCDYVDQTFVEFRQDVILRLVVWRDPTDISL
jgi:hypothetical protein